MAAVYGIPDVRYPMEMARFWLLKCEPDVYSIGDLARDGTTGWDAIRNYQVRNFLRDDMSPGDLGIFYHSNADPSGAVGVLRIERSGVPDPTQFDPRSEYHDPRSTRAAPTWLMCEVRFVERFAEVISLERMRGEQALADMMILRKGNRLSITPLTQGEFDSIRELGRSAGADEPSADVQSRKVIPSVGAKSPRKPSSSIKRR